MSPSFFSLSLTIGLCFFGVLCAGVINEGGKHDFQMTEFYFFKFYKVILTLNRLPYVRSWYLANFWYILIIFAGTLQDLLILCRTLY